MTRTRRANPGQTRPTATREGIENVVDIERLAASVASSLRIAGFEVRAKSLLEELEPERLGPEARAEG